jgi:rsbT co-antagonist protein RsbR
MASLEKVEKVFKKKEREILEFRMKNQLSSIGRRKDLISDKQLREDSTFFLNEFIKAIRLGNIEDISGSEYDEIKKQLKKLSRNRAQLGLSASETATYIFSLKNTLFPYMQEAYKDEPFRLVKETSRINNLLDEFGLLTLEDYSKGREQIIKEQSETLLELSSPIITLWDNVLAVPVVGTLDSKRTQVIMENLLKMIVDRGSRIAIIDITGVGVVDTQVANHLLKTASAIKLLGAEAIVTGIRPEVAQTIVTLGVELGNIITKASLADGLRHAFRDLNYTVVKTEK